MRLTLLKFWWILYPWLVYSICLWDGMNKILSFDNFLNSKPFGRSVLRQQLTQKEHNLVAYAISGFFIFGMGAAVCTDSENVRDFLIMSFYL